MTPEQQLQLLVDRAEISDVLHRYATGLDTRDWTLYRSIFTDELVMDFASVGGRSGPMSAEEWIEGVRVTFAGLDATQHLSANHVHDIRGDEATCTSYMRAVHVMKSEDGDEFFTIGGYYTNHLVRSAGGWKLCRITLTVTWRQGNDQLLRLASRRGRERLGLTRPSS